jgi:hypothetical protein
MLVITKIIMSEILVVKVISLGGSLGKLFLRISAALSGNLEDHPKVQVPCCELRAWQSPQCRWRAAGLFLQATFLFSHCRLSTTSPFIFNMELHCPALELCRKTIFLTSAKCGAEHKRPAVICCVPLLQFST